MVFEKEGKNVIVTGLGNGDKFNISETPMRGKRIYRVWTILDRTKLLTRYCDGKPYTVGIKDANPIHWTNAFIEDCVHDWTVRGDLFIFHAHSSYKGQQIDLLIQLYEE